MMRQRGGLVVMIGSVTSLLSAPFGAAYAGQGRLRLLVGGQAERMRHLAAGCWNHLSAA